MKKRPILFAALGIVLASCNVQAVIIDVGSLDGSSADFGTPDEAPEVNADDILLDPGTLTDPGVAIDLDGGADLKIDLGTNPDDGGVEVFDSSSEDIHEPIDLPIIDTGVPDAGAPDVINDTGPDVPVDTGPTTTAWNACESDDDCIEGPCLPSVNGKFCTIPCTGFCENGYVCKPLLDMQAPPNCINNDDCPQGYECEVVDYETGGADWVSCNPESCNETSGFFFGICNCDPSCLESGDCCEDFCEICGLDVEACRECVIPEGQESEVPEFCVDTNVHLCKPCTTDSDCRSFGGGYLDHCTRVPSEIDLLGTNSSYCLRHCGTQGGETPEPIHAICKDPNACQIVDIDSEDKPVYRCVPPDGQCPCSQWAVDSGATSTCSQGECNGTRSCEATDSSSTCNLCPPEVECTASVCNPTEGCEYTIADGACDDGNACTTVDACSEGTCFGTTPPECNDEDQCTADACNTLQGCVHQLMEGTPCDDGDPCTSGDLCTTTGCQGGLAGSGFVLEQSKIAENQNGFTGPLKSLDNFGISCQNMGIENEDGSLLIAVGAWDHDNPGSVDEGAIWMITIDTSGAVISEHIITDGQPGFNGTLETDDLFGGSIALLGDFANNGTLDLVVGAPGDDYGSGADVGAIWFLEFAPGPNGQLIKTKRIGENGNGFGDDEIAGGDEFGASVAAVGDLDGNGYIDLAIGSPGYDTEKANSGTIWLFFMTVDQETGVPLVESYLKILPPVPNSSDRFGSSLAFLGDPNQSGSIKLAVGAPGADEGRVNILSLSPEGTVMSNLVIGEGFGGFSADLGTADKFGSSVSNVGDIDGDGIADLAVGAANDDGPANAYSNIGATWILFLNPDGSVKGHHKITQNQGGFTGALSSTSNFGSCATGLGDLNQDGFADLMVGAAKGGVSDRGEAWVLFLGNQDCIEEPEAP